MKPGEKRSFEALADYSFPSEPENKLSTSLFDKLAMLSANQSAVDFSAAIGFMVISLWSQCLEEEYVGFICGTQRCWWRPMLTLRSTSLYISF